ncbi:B12-binding domain-containing radical SAM protein [bacterium]|nr:B12-binding domain-containing radical SAM protein [bacterium]
MKALLIYPEIPETFWSFKHALKFIRKRAAFPPLGLLTVGALLPPRWEKKLVDENVADLTDEQLAWADCAFVSAMTVQRDTARALIARCKKAGLPVVAGGPLFTSEHERFPEVDHFVLNEAEVTLPPFIEDWERGCAKPLYTSNVFPDVARSPRPLWELAEIKRYATMNVQYSRGCPFDCEFCNITALFGHQPRVKTPAQVIGELDALYGRGWRGPVFFVDDNFIGNRFRLKNELLPALIAWRAVRPSVTFHTEVSINIVDDEELMALMAEAGFDMVFIGIETPDAESLAECKKVQNKGRDLVADVKKIQRAGLQVQGGFIVGFDNDTPSIFQRQIDFIQKSGIVTAMVGMLQAMPGTKLYERMEREGRLVGQTTGDNVDGTTNIVTTMSFETLREGYRSIMRNIYSPGQYYERLRTFLREYKTPRVRPRVTVQRFMAFLRSLVHLGILGKERWQYWRFLIWVGTHRPQLISLGVTMAIYGQHFRRMCETQLRG